MSEPLDGAAAVPPAAPAPPPPAESPTRPAFTAPSTEAFTGVIDAGERQDRKKVVSTVIGIALLFITLVVVGVATRAPILNELRDPSYARGLITFLISIGTIALAFIIIVQALLGAGSPDDQDGRFRRAREVFSVLMGVLGTIVGFYFGSAEKEGVNLEIGGPEVIELGGGERRVAAHVFGGTAPYHYEISFSDKQLPKIEKNSENGWIVERFKTSGEPTVTVEVSDKKGRKASATSKTAPAAANPNLAPNPTPKPG